MKILHLMPYSPVPPNFGGALRNYNILKNILPHHDVTLAMFGNQTDEQKLRQEFKGSIQNIHTVSAPWQRKHYRLGQFYSTLNSHSFFHMLAVNNEMQLLIDRILSNDSYDIVQTEFSHLGSYRLMTDAVKILDAHNVEYDNFRRMWLNDHRPIRKFHYFLEYKKLFKEEIKGCGKQDALFVTSERDKKLFDKDIPNIPKFVIPNGVDSNFFSSGDNQPEPFTLVFTGMMAYVPNYDGMLYFLDEIFPIVLKKFPSVKVYIVGNRPPKQLSARASDNVIITGFVEDVRPYIRRASVYIVPLRMGGGTRLKIGEALSMKIPIVTTSIGCEGIDIVSGESAIIADDPISFANGIISLIQDDSMKKKLVRNGYDVVQSKYEWSVIGKRILELYQDLVIKTKTQDANHKA
ncbi:MAG: glycosyltransferase family 4 protein [Bacteroidota bacterium]|nr:glycosyltransferase family 4 protein [Bacteroidota bacterium]